MANRLADATSPYLEQHKDNPVDWWQWSPAAFEEAKRRDVPVLISVGYAACHWCHVMAHESFEDESAARIVNALTVPIKVDREERPDIDAVYMTATQAMTGQGGWPMTVFATPDGEPFFCGTYYPRDQFVRLVQAVADAWRNQREEVLRQGAVVVEAINQATGAPEGGPPSGEITAGLLDSGVASLLREYDDVHGGFGGAPKFPPHMALLFLLRHHQRTGDREALEVVRHTCEQMARGGLYDQLGGGFSRYSVDDHWLVPHFEKMLYDNALLLRVYTHLWRLTGDPLAARVANETAAFLCIDLATDDGGLASALDADTNGEEGLTYVWTPAQLREALGDYDGDWAADLLGVTAEGTFEHGTSVLRLARDIDSAEPALQERWARIKAVLLGIRRHRPQPSRDNKIVSSWAGLAVTALCEFVLVSQAMGTELEPAFRATALKTASVLVDRHIVDGRLRRASRAGVVGAPVGVLEDYGAVAEALLAVHQLTGEPSWVDTAKQLLDVALNHFDDGLGGFHDTADDSEKLVARPADPTDNATPSGLSSVVAALVTYAALTGETTYREAAEAALRTVAPLLGKHARFAGYAAAAAEALVSGPYEIAIATEDRDNEPLLATAWRYAPPGAVIVAGPPDQLGVPLLESRILIDGEPTAYVCQGMVCDLPVTTVDDLVTKLTG